MSYKLEFIFFIKIQKKKFEKRNFRKENDFLKWQISRKFSENFWKMQCSRAFQTL